MKIQRIITLLLAIVLTAGLVYGCKPKEEGKKESEKFELALITDYGTIDDKSFNQGSWEGLKKYAEEFGKTYRYYQPAGKGTEYYLDSIEMAVGAGAKVIVTPGFLFEEAIYIAQDIYTDVKFILIDGSPHNADYTDFKTGPNTVGVHYAEHQSGFLAGYAAVKDGYRSLGYMGGMAFAPVVRFGIGFIQGAEYAAAELGLGANSVTIRYHYTGTFNASPEIQTMASAWYNDGIEVIFACGGAIGNSIMNAAEATGGKVIGVDVDQSNESATVITSAMKELGNSVYDCIKDYYANKFKGGQDLVFDASNLGVGLPMGTSRFSSFKQTDYDAIFAKLKSGSLTVTDDSVAIADIPAANVAVTVIE